MAVLDPFNPNDPEHDSGSASLPIKLAVRGHIRMNLTDGSINSNRDLLLAEISGGDMTKGVLSDTCYYTPIVANEVATDIGDVTVVHRGIGDAGDSQGTHAVAGTGDIPANARAGSTAGTSYMVCVGAKPEYWKAMITLFP